MKIYLASDHAGFDYKEAIKKHLKNRHLQYTIIDLGTHSKDRANYALFGQKMGQEINKDPKSWGIAICGSGIGISIAVNRHKYARAARVVSLEDVKLSRQHNNANVLALGARVVSQSEALKFTDVFLNTSFEGGRHIKRVESLDNY